MIHCARKLRPTQLTFDSDDDDNEQQTDNLPPPQTNTSSNGTLRTMDGLRDDVGKFVAVVYDSKWYIVVVLKQNTEMGDVDLCFMAPAGPKMVFQWPTQVDECIVL